MANTLNITFIAPAVEGDTFQFLINPGPVNIVGEFVALRNDPYLVTIGSDATDQAQKFYEAFIIDYGSQFNASISGTVVSISAISGANIFNPSFGSYATFQIVGNGISTTGLEGDRYLINNEIWISATTGYVVDSYSVVIQNLFNQNISAPVTLYPNQAGEVFFDISPYLKSLFEYPADSADFISPVPNSNTFKITITSSDGYAVSLTKIFIRGGRRTNDTNQTLPSNSILRPTPVVPVWPGFDTQYYVFEGGAIVKKNIISIDPEFVDNRRAKGCNNVYLKFLNQFGTYSNWLFDTYGKTNSNNPIGTFVRNNRVDDLGQESTTKLKLSGKVPAAYIDIINDLIISPEVYRRLPDGNWERMPVSKASVEYEPSKNAYAVSFNFDMPYRFNPSLLW